MLTNLDLDFADDIALLEYKYIPYGRGLLTRTAVAAKQLGLVISVEYI